MFLDQKLQRIYPISSILCMQVVLGALTPNSIFFVIPAEWQTFQSFWAETD